MCGRERRGDPQNPRTSEPQNPRTLCAALLALLIATAALHAWDRGHVPDYHDRRARLAAQTTDGVVVLFGYAEADAAASVTPFHQNEAFYYLSGWNQPGAMLMIVPDAHASGQAERAAREILYVPARDPQQERWTGPTLDPDGPDAAPRTGVAEVRRASLLPTDLVEALKNSPKIYTELTPQPESGEDAFVADTVARLKALAPLAEFQDVRPLLQSMRAIKSPGEVALIRRAAENSMAGHAAAMRALRPGMREFEIGALIKYEFERRGAEWPSYPAIVGSGFYSTVLHYDADDQEMQAGDLVVVDAAGSYGGYASDITRTLPVSGRFTARQREIYDVVRGAQAAAIAAARPGVRLTGRTPGSLFQIAYDYINTHGRDGHGAPLGAYFIHGVGHSVGLNVHDPMNTEAPLAPGMVVTIEPGIYIPDERLGVRIEDMILITQDGCEVLTKALTSDPAEIERVMATK